VQLLRNRSRPYLFSNTVAPTIVAASLAVVNLIERSDDLRRKLESNTQKFRAGMTAAGFSLRPGNHPIVPIMLGEAKVASEMARKLLEKGIYVIGFSFPVVSEGKARIRVQLSAAHSDKHIEAAVGAFAAVAREMGVLK
jgi:glycine C-acetyltransferase